MPTLTKDGASAVAYVPLIFSLPLEYHLLRAVAVMDLGIATTHNSIAVEAGIGMGAPEQVTKLIPLLSGMIGGVGELGWTGSIPVEPGMLLYCEVIGTTTNIVRLSAILWRIALTEGGNFVLDP